MVSPLPEAIDEAESDAEAERLDALFQALASRPRRAILDLLHRQPGCNVQTVAAAFSCSRIAVLRHIDVLEAAALVVSRKQGRERLLWFNVVPLTEIQQRWTDRYTRFFASSLLDLRWRVEAGPDPEEKDA
jgi:DNA-binding transcriptional ArsR family regulator